MRHSVTHEVCDAVRAALMTHCGRAMPSPSRACAVAAAEYVSTDTESTASECWSRRCRKISVSRSGVSRLPGQRTSSRSRICKSVCSKQGMMNPGVKARTDTASMECCSTTTDVNSTSKNCKEPCKQVPMNSCSLQILHHSKVEAYQGRYNEQAYPQLHTRLCS